MSTQDYVQKLALASFPGSRANKQLNRKGLHFSVLQATESGESCSTKFVLLTITGTSCLLFIILVVVMPRHTYLSVIFNVLVCRAKTAEIPLKECSAYGQVDQGGAEREEPHIYEHP